MEQLSDVQDNIVSNQNCSTLMNLQERMIDNILILQENVEKLNQYLGNVSVQICKTSKGDFTKRVEDKKLLFLALCTNSLIGNLIILLEEQKQSEQLQTYFKILEWVKSRFAFVLQLDSQDKRFPIIAHYVIQILAYPFDPELDYEKNYLDSIIKEKIKIIEFNSSPQLEQLLISSLIKKATTEISLKAFQEINNCFQQNLHNKDQTKDHVESLIKQKFENKRIYVITYVNKNDEAETMFDQSTSISLTHDINSLKPEDVFTNAWALIQFSNFEQMILHEICHDRRVVWVSQNNYLKSSPQKLNEEVGEFYETFVFQSIRIDNVDQANIFQEIRDWVFDENQKCSKLGQLLTNSVVQLASYDSNIDSPTKLKKLVAKQPRSTRCANRRKKTFTF